MRVFVPIFPGHVPRNGVSIATTRQGPPRSEASNGLAFHLAKRNTCLGVDTSSYRCSRPVKASSAHSACLHNLPHTFFRELHPPITICVIFSSPSPFFAYKSVKITVLPGTGEKQTLRPRRNNADVTRKRKATFFDSPALATPTTTTTLAHRPFPSLHQPPAPWKNNQRRGPATSSHANVSQTLIIVIAICHARNYEGLCCFVSFLASACPLPPGKTKHRKLPVQTRRRFRSVAPRKRAWRDTLPASTQHEEK